MFRTSAGLVSEETIDAMASTLRELGFVVVHPARAIGEGETPREFCNRLGLHIQSLRRTLARCANQPAHVRRGRRNILRIITTPALDDEIRRRIAIARRGATRS